MLASLIGVPQVQIRKSTMVVVSHTAMHTARFVCDVHCSCTQSGKRVQSEHLNMNTNQWEAMQSGN